MSTSDESLNSEMWQSAAADQLDWAHAYIDDELLAPPDGCISWHVGTHFGTYSIIYDDPDMLVSDLSGYYGDLRVGSSSGKYSAGSPTVSTQDIVQPGWHSLVNDHTELVVESATLDDGAASYTLLDTGWKDEAPDSEPGSVARFAHAVGSPICYRNVFLVSYIGAPPEELDKRNIRIAGMPDKYEALAVNFPLGDVIRHLGKLTGIPDTDIETVNRQIAIRPELRRTTGSGQTYLTDDLGGVRLARIVASLPTLPATKKLHRNSDAEICRGFRIVRLPGRNGDWHHIADKNLRIDDARASLPRFSLPDIRLEVHADTDANDRMRAAATLLSRQPHEIPAYQHGWIIPEDRGATVVLR